MKHYRELLRVGRLRVLIERPTRRPCPTPPVSVGPERSDEELLAVEEQLNAERRANGWRLVDGTKSG